MPKLATLIGLNESIVLQQVHYWLKSKEQRKQDYIDGRYWVYNTYEQWQEQFPFWSIRTLKRIFTTLENSGLLLSANHNKIGFDKTKWYSINYDALNAVSASCQNVTMIVPTCHYGECQSDTTYTIDYPKTHTKTSFNVLHGAKPRYENFDSSILEKQIIKSCNNYGITDYELYISIIEYYYKSYLNAFGEEHPRLSTKAMNSVIEAINLGTDMVKAIDLEAYCQMIDKHFQTQYENCDYSICHFMTEGIRNNRFYETCY